VIAARSFIAEPEDGLELTTYRLQDTTAGYSIALMSLQI
jgi:hypothetical protein